MVSCCLLSLSASLLLGCLLLPAAVAPPKSNAPQDNGKTAYLDTLFSTTEGTPCSRDNKPDKPIAFILGGGSAAGKSTASKSYHPWTELTKHLTASCGGYVEINTDAMMSKHAGYKKACDDGDAALKPKNPYGAWCLGYKFRHTFMDEKWRKDAVDRAITEKRHIMLDCTMQPPKDYIELLRRLTKAGYTLNILGVTCNTVDAAVRALKRGDEKGRDGYVRYVSLPEVHKYHRAFSLAFEVYRNLEEAAGSIVLYDTCSEKTPIEIYEKGAVLSGQETKYQAFLDKAKLTLKQLATDLKAKDATTATKYDGFCAGCVDLQCPKATAPAPTCEVDESKLVAIGYDGEAGDLKAFCELLGTGSKKTYPLVWDAKKLGEAATKNAMAANRFAAMFASTIIMPLPECYFDPATVIVPKLAKKFCTK